MERRLISGHSPYEGVAGFSRAVVADGRVHVAGTAPIPPDGSPAPASAYEQVRDKLAYGFIDRGGQQVKNIARPVQVYAVAPAVPAPGPAARPPTAHPSAEAPGERRAAL